MPELPRPPGGPPASGASPCRLPVGLALAVAAAGCGRPTLSPTDGASDASGAAAWMAADEPEGGRPAAGTGAALAALAALGLDGAPRPACGGRLIGAAGGDIEHLISPLDLARVCERDPTPDVSLVGSVDLTSLDPLLGLGCLCEVQGTLSITDVRTEAALEALAGLRHVGGLAINNDDSVRDLRPLSRLGPVAYLSLSDLPALETLDGAPALAPMGRLKLSRLTRLTDLGSLSEGEPVLHLTLAYLPVLEPRALPPLISDGGALTIQYVPGLRSLRGVGDVRSIDSLDLRELTALADLSALASVEEAREVSLVELPALGSLRGLDRLRAVDTFEISELDSLRRLDGLGCLEEAGRLRLTDNPALTSLEGLGPEVSIETLTLERDDALTRAGEGGWPQVRTLTARELPALSVIGATVCGLTDRCRLTLEELPELDALPPMGDAGLEELRLRGLPRLRSLGDALRLHEPAFVEVERLDSLVALDATLTSVYGLPLPEITSLSLASMPALRSVRWGSGVEYGSVGLSDLPLVTDLDGLGVFRFRLTVESMDSLSSLRGIGVPADGVWSVELTDLPALRSLEGLDRLIIDDSLVLTDLPALVDLDALTLYSRVQSISLTRTGVVHLRLPPAAYNRTASLTAAENPALQTVALDAIAEYGSVSISDSPLFSGFSSPVTATGMVSVSLRRLGGLTEVEAFRPLRWVRHVTVEDNPALPPGAADWLCALASSSCVITP